MNKKVVIGTLSTLLAVGGGYMVGYTYYLDRYLENTHFLGVDIGGLTIEDALEKVNRDVSSKKIRVVEDGEAREIPVSSLLELGDYESDLRDVLESSDPSLWWLAGEKSSFQLENVKVNTERLKTELGVDNHTRTSSQDAYLARNGDGRYFIEKEVVGNQIDFNRLASDIEKSLSEGRIEVTVSYLQPSVLSTDGKLVSQLERIKSLADRPFTLKMGEIEESVELESWLTESLEWDVEKIKEDLATLNSTYASRGNPYTFNSTLRGEVVVPAGTLGWEIDILESLDRINLSLAEGKESAELVLFGSNRGVNGVGSNYIEVDLASQMMFVYRDGELLLETPIVSGRLGTDTIPGAYYVLYKQEDAVLRGYNPHTKLDYAQPVSYWIPFDDTGQGIHDASWQSSFGGDAYLSRGSLGCINTPPNVMGEVYRLAEEGLPVLVFE